jgi:hypothetical protein
MKPAPPFLEASFWLILSIASAAGMGFYVASIWGAGQPAGFSDLYAPWWGAHELFLRGRNPYTPAVAHEIQGVIYGAAPIAAHSGDPSEMAGGFAYPLYASFLLWPTIHMRFRIVQLLVTGVSATAVVGSLLMCFHGVRYRASPIRLVTLILFTIGSFPVLQSLQLQNLSLIAGGMLMLAVYLLVRGRLTLAGAVLAASTFKPQFTILLVPWLAQWTLSDWRRRQFLAWSFLSSMATLIAASEWLLPGWIGDFLRAVRAYRSYTFGKSLLDLWFTDRGAPFATLAMLLAAIILCWRYRRYPANSPATFVAISLILAATLVVIPTLAPHTQILLLPGILCLLRCGYPPSVSGRLATLAVWLLLIWPWAAALAMTLSALRLPMNVLSRWWEIPLFTSPVLPLAVLFALGCLVGGQGLAEANIDREHP